MFEGDYDRERAEQEFGVTHLPDVRKILEQRLGHSDFSVVPITQGFRIIIFKAESCNSI